MAPKLLTFALLAAGTSAGQSEFFPLHAGNQWIYRSNVDVRVVEIARTAQFQGRQYALLRNGFGGEDWLRMDDNGTLLRYDPQTQREQTWVAFATPEGGAFETALDPCNQRGVVTAAKAPHTGPVGEFAETFQVRYPSANCADGGLEREVYARWIGLVQRVHITIAGPRVYDLIYARIGGVTVLSERELSFSITLDRSLVEQGALLVRMTLRHSQPQPLSLLFGSGQTYEIAIRDEKGDIVHRWSDGKGFILIVRNESFPAGERNWVEPLRLSLPPGRYAAEAWLATTPRQFSASAGFEVKRASPRPARSTPAR
ncbi:MAG: BsuPI-related putative proteinase inhibitor [Bryobacteraceae bacterium]